MTRKIIIVLLTTLMLLSLASCKTKDILTGDEVPNKEWDLIEHSAEKTVVNLYTTVVDEEMKAWLGSEFSREVLEKHGIEINVKMFKFENVLLSLEEDILNEITNGQIDLLILKDDEFSQLKTNGYLYEKIAEKIPNTFEYINMLDLEINSEHGVLLDGYGVPFGKEQFVLMFDEDELEVYPYNTDELLEFLKDNKGKFTYTNPINDETGAEFIRTVIYEIIGKEKIAELLNSELMISEENLYERIKPALDYLVELDKYVLKDQGEYFTRLRDVDQLFLEGELYFSICSDFAYATTAISDETYPDGARSFIFENGTIGDTTYLTVPVNASNKTGALVAINELLSLKMQLSKYTPKIWGNLPVVDLNLLSEVEAEKFKKVSVKRNTVRVEDLFKARYPELPINIQEMINNLWDEHVNKGE